jgi:hypothetical protein
VLACEFAGEVTDTVNPVAEIAVIAGDSRASADVVGVSTTNGTAGSVALKVTVTSAPVVALPPVPQVRDPRTIVEPASTTGAGGVVPALAPAAAVTVEVSHAEYPHSAALAEVATRN